MAVKGERGGQRQDGLSWLSPYLDAGVRSADPDLLRLAITQAETELASPDPAAAAIARAVRGTALCKLYETDGNMRWLHDGLADLRDAYHWLRSHASRTYSPAGVNLACALVRAGEQQGDVALLREGAALADALLTGEHDRSALVNAKAVAEMRIGIYGGDPAAVDAAIVVLRAHETSDGLTPDEKSQTIQNLCAALTESARQSRSVQAYRDLLDWLKAKSDPIQDEVSAFFAHYHAQVAVELFALGGDPGPAAQSLATMERIVTWYAGNQYRRPEALHSLAQIHFQIGKRGEDAEGHFTAAIAAAEEALRLTGQDARNTDSRRHRLLAALGTYTVALGLTTRDAQIVERARLHYAEALALIGPAKAPVLFATVAQGLFYLLYQREDWHAALEVFRDIESAWDRVVADPGLSGAVHRQGARELAGQHTRAARAHAAIGDAAGAVLTLDRGRARQLHLTLGGLRLEELGDLSAEDVKRVAAARDAVTRARASSSDEECRRTWETYLDVRRQAGLDAQVEHLTFEDARARVPAHGAIVQLLLDAGGSCALLLVDGEAAVRIVPLPSDAYRLVNALFDPASTRGWVAVYRRFLNRHAGGTDSQPPPAEIAASLEALEHCRRTLGIAVFDAVHRGLHESGLRPSAEIVISPPGQLAYLPVSAATLGDGSAFNEHWSVSVTPRLSALRPRTAATDVHHQVGILAPPVEGDRRLTPLPYAAREAVLLAGRLPSNAMLAMERAGADISSILRMFGEVSIVHAACHGIYDRAEPDLSGLELGDQRRLSIRRLSASTASLRHLRLVMLSACESAITGVGAVPDEFIGLPVAFLQAGARAVIGTLWPVLDDVAMATTDQFYRHYLDESGREKMAPARALSMAQSWVRTASLRDLLDAGYLTADEAANLPSARGGATAGGAPPPVGLRGLSIVVNPALDATSRPAPVPRPLSAEALAHRPYRAAMDWAPFVMLGS